MYRTMSLTIYLLFILIVIIFIGNVPEKFFPHKTLLILKHPSLDRKLQMMQTSKPKKIFQTFIYRKFFYVSIVINTLFLEQPFFYIRLQTKRLMGFSLTKSIQKCRIRHDGFFLSLSLFMIIIDIRMFYFPPVNVVYEKVNSQIFCNVYKVFTQLSDQPLH